MCAAVFNLLENHFSLQQLWNDNLGVSYLLSRKENWQKIAEMWGNEMLASNKAKIIYCHSLDVSKCQQLHDKVALWG